MHELVCYANTICGPWIDDPFPAGYNYIFWWLCIPLVEVAYKWFA